MHIENKLVATKGEGGGSVNQDYGINRYTLPYIKQMNKLLYSRGNYTQQLVVTCSKEAEKEYIYIYIIYISIKIKNNDNSKFTEYRKKPMLS